MKKFFIIFTIMITITIARPIVTLLPYYSYTHYSDQIKKNSNTVGYIASLYNNPHLLELSASYSNILYKGNYPLYEQTEITTIYSYFLNKKFKLKGGLHFVASDFRATNEGLATLISGLDYQFQKNSFGAELFRSQYKHYKPKPLTIWQVHPYFAHTIANFGLNVDYNYIHAENSKLYKGILSNYHSSGLKVTKHSDKWITSIGGWVGKRAFALEDGGFTLYNLSQIYTSGLSTEVKYHIQKGANIALKYSRKNYKNSGQKGHSDGITSSFSYSW